MHTEVPLMSETYQRVQMLLEPSQRKTLTEIARRRGKSIAEVTRQAINLGLNAMTQEDEIVKRQIALESARQLRQSMPLLRVDVVGDIQKLHEDRDEPIIPSGH
jgi:hypothetical protein